MNYSKMAFAGLVMGAGIVMLSSHTAYGSPGQPGERDENAQTDEGTEAEDGPGQCTDAVFIREQANTSSRAHGQCFPGHSTTAHCKASSEGVQLPGQPPGTLTYVWYYITDHSTGVVGWVTAAYYRTDYWATPWC